MLRRYGIERDVAVGEVLFADGDETYDLIVLLDGTADLIQGYGRTRQCAWPRAGHTRG